MKLSKSQVLQVLSPYGNWSHPQGMQIVNRAAAQKMRSSLTGGLGKVMGRKLPIYIGHPDDNKTFFKSPKPIGYICDIHETEGGITITAEYEENIYRDVISGKYKGLSPRWEMKHLDGTNYTPVRLISAGLTNSPNIPDSGRILSVANEFSQPNISECKEIALRNSQTCTKIVERARACLKNANNNANDLKSEAVGLRISKLHAPTQTENSQRKISSTQLSQMALERSERLGEAYSKSFATLRREFRCK